MSNKTSFVVDADIARSAGLTMHPVSMGSRQALDEILKNQHQVVFCQSLLDEWKKHRSNYASTWLTTMISKKFFEKVIHDNAVKSSIVNSKLTSVEKAISTKDSHVIDSALVHKSLVLSNDDNARNVFSKLANEIGYIKCIHWVNPVIHNKALIQYMGNVGIPPSGWRL